jgi:hypothetical protein
MSLDPFVVDRDHVVERSRNLCILRSQWWLPSLDLRVVSQHPKDPQSGLPAFF